MQIRVLVINPGSTSTKIALYEDGKPVKSAAVSAGAEARPGDRAHRSCSVIEELPGRTGHVAAFLEEAGIRPEKLSAIAARGAPLAPVPAGTYRVNAAMLEDCRSDRYVMHVSRLAALIADGIGRHHGVPAFVVDPVSVDEFEPVARVSGLAECPRVSLLHALNIRRVAMKYAAEIGRPYRELNLIVAHMGGGCSIAAHSGGRMIDAVDANGEGPFSAERSGGLRTDSLVRLCFSGRFRDAADAIGYLTRSAGVAGHLGTSDLREAGRRAAAGDDKAALVLDAMACQTAKHIAAMAAVLKGRVDAVLLTGGAAASGRITDAIISRVSFLGPVRVYPGEDEMAALYEGVERVLTGREKARIYPTGEFEAG
ncbi:MAG: butyrate kinase [Planctomycetota bacterium]|nr:butyrate kinase [Planctomycetota bacterium]